MSLLQVKCCSLCQCFSFKAKDEGGGPREGGEEDGEGSGCHTEAAGEVRAGVIQFPPTSLTSQGGEEEGQEAP